MQDEVNEKTVSLCIRCGKVTANLLKAAMKKALVKMEQEKQKLQGQKQPKQDKEDKTYRGKQSMDKLGDCKRHCTFYRPGIREQYSSYHD